MLGTSSGYRVPSTVFKRLNVLLLKYQPILLKLTYDHPKAPGI